MTSEVHADTHPGAGICRARPKTHPRPARVRNWAKGPGKVGGMRMWWTGGLTREGRGCCPVRKDRGCRLNRRCRGCSRPVQAGGGCRPQLGAAGRQEAGRRKHRESRRGGWQQGGASRGAQRRGSCAGIMKVHPLLLQSKGIRLQLNSPQVVVEHGLEFSCHPGSP